MASPSVSLAVPTSQDRVPPSTASPEMDTDASTGGLLPRVTDALAAVPVVLPSLGVTVQVTVSPAAALPAARVAPVPSRLEPVVQATLELSGSSSSSSKVQEQVSASPEVGLSGEMVTSETVGAVLSMETVFDGTAAPSSVPSVGVTEQKTVSPLSKNAPVRVSVVATDGLPETIQAVT